MEVGELPRQVHSSGKIARLGHASTSLLDGVEIGVNNNAIWSDDYLKTARPPISVSLVELIALK